MAPAPLHMFSCPSQALTFKALGGPTTLVNRRAFVTMNVLCWDWENWRTTCDRSPSLPSTRGRDGRGGSSQPLRRGRRRIRSQSKHVQHGDGALRVEFRPAPAARRVRSGCDCHILLASNVMGGAEKACYWSFFEAELQPALNRTLNYWLRFSGRVP